MMSCLYTKPTYRNSLCHAESFHPIPLKKSRPVSQLNPLKTICNVRETIQVKEGCYPNLEKEMTKKCAENKVDPKEQSKLEKSKPHLIYCTKTKNINDISKRLAYSEMTRPCKKTR